METNVVYIYSSVFWQRFHLRAHDDTHKTKELEWISGQTKKALWLNLRLPFHDVYKGAARECSLTNWIIHINRKVEERENEFQNANVICECFVYMQR